MIPKTVNLQHNRQLVGVHMNFPFPQLPPQKQVFYTNFKHGYLHGVSTHPKLLKKQLIKEGFMLAWFL